MNEVWVRFNSHDEYLEQEEKLFSVLGEAPGYNAVVVYIADKRECKKLHEHNFDETQIALLKNAFGEKNVRCQEEKIRSVHVEPRHLLDVLQIIPCNDTMYAIVEDSDGTERRCKVLLYALCSDYEVYPVFFDSFSGVCCMNDAISNVKRFEMEGGEIRKGVKNESL